MRVVRPGRVGYAEALSWQRESAAALRAGSAPETLYLLTHAPVVTMGRRATEKHVLFSREELAARGVEIVEKIDHPDVRRLLAELALGPADAHLTRDARAALERWDRRRQP